MLAPRFALTKSDLVILSLAYIADGDWQPLTEDVALKTILRFFALCRSEPEQIVFDMYREMQNRLMARRQGTFEEIQLAEPFSEFGQRNLQALAVAYAESAEERVKKQWDAIFSAGWKEKKPLELPVVCLGGAVLRKKPRLCWPRQIDTSCSGQNIGTYTIVSA